MSKPILLYAKNQKERTLDKRYAKLAGLMLLCEETRVLLPEYKPERHHNGRFFITKPAA